MPDQHEFREQRVVKAGTDSSAGTQDWRRKYYDSLDSLEREQQQYKAMDAVFKRLTGRLCIASLGQSPQLDEQIKKLQATLRGDASPADLEKLTTVLSDAINALDQSEAPPTKGSAPSASVAPASSPSVSMTQVAAEDSTVGDERLRVVLSTLLAELRRDHDLIGRVDALDSKLAGSLTREQLADLFAVLTEIVGQRIRHIELAKMEVEALLSQMVGKLDEISQSFADQNETHSQSLASSETLNTHLAVEMKAMGESVDSNDDLEQIRAQVRGRLESIDRHLHEFREREAALASEYRARNEKMSARMAELEAEANRLQNQLRDEQKTASIDVLTKVPNRKAYDRRIEEELKRWQRFKQPTCVAAWDVDHFKRINDTYGHRAGDGVLRAVADCLAGRIRATDFLARYGGEEFVMILSGTKPDDAVRLVDLMRIAISKLKMHYKGTPLAITISSGVTAIQAGDTAASVFERADKALYQAKEQGRNRCIAL